MLSRRNALAVLGISSAAGFSTEDAFAKDDKPVNGYMIPNNASKVSAALRRLADEMDAKSIDVLKLNVSSDLERNKLVTQRLTIDFVIKP